MHILRFLLSAVVLILGINAVPFTAQGTRQGWYGSGTYQLVNAATKTAADLSGGITLVQGWQRDTTFTNPNQLWIITLFDSTHVFIQNIKTLGAITNTGLNKQTTGTPLDASKKTQIWTLKFLDNGNVQFVSASDTGNVLDLSQSDPHNGTPIITHPNHGGPNQQWQFFSQTSSAVAENGCALTVNGELSGSSSTESATWMLH